MDIRLTVVLLGVLLCQIHGHPRAAKGSAVSSSADTKRIVPLEIVEKTTVGKKEESTGKPKTPLTSVGAKLKSRLMEDSKLPTTSRESQDEAVRSARQSPSPPFGHMSFGKGPHSTTVCIQVRSDHQPQVICGPQFGEGEGQPPAPAAARYAAPFEYARPAPQGYSKGPYAPARGFPTRRTEEDTQPPRPVTPNHQPAAGLAPQNYQQPPSREISSAPSGPVYVHRNYYQPVYSAGLMTLAQALMRLNCAVEPSGQIVSPQLVRGGALGYQDQQFGDSVFSLPDGSPAKFGANIVSPAPMRTPQGPGQQWARSMADEDMAYLNSQMLGSPQNYPSGGWNFGAYGGESYPLEMMQGRSAGGEDGSYSYLGYPAESPGFEDFARREYLQLQALRESKDKLRAIQEQLNDFKEREQLEKLNSKNSSAPGTSSDSSGTGLSIDIKATPTKANKRQARI